MGAHNLSHVYRSVQNVFMSVMCITSFQISPDLYVKIKVLLGQIRLLKVMAKS